MQSNQATRMMKRQNSDMIPASQVSNGPPDRIMGSVPVSPESLLIIVWRSRWLVLFSALVAIAGGFVIIQRTTPLYSSTSRLCVEKRGPKLLKDEEVGVMMQSNNYLYMQAELLKSLPIISAVLEQDEIKHCRTLQESTGDPLSYIANNLSVSVGKKDDILNVSFTSPYPVEAAAITNALVDAYVTFHANQKKNSSGEILKILQEEQIARSQELSRGVKAMGEFQRDNELLALDDNSGNIVFARLNRLSTALTEAQLSRLEAESFFETVSAILNNPEQLSVFSKNPSIISPPRQSKGGSTWLNNQGRSQMEAELAQLKQTRVKALSIRKPNHPTVLALDKEIQLLEESMPSEGQLCADMLYVAAGQHLEEARKIEAKLQSEFDAHRGDALKLNDKLSQYAILRTNYERTKELCVTIDERIRDLNLSEDTGAMNIIILEFAQPKYGPVQPQKARILAMSLVMGLMVGGGLALLRDMVNHRIRNADEATAILGVPLLGTFPILKRNATQAERATLAASQTTSIAAEACRAIRTSVFFSVPYDQARVIQVTSGMQGEGKSTLASNLAITIAQTGQHTLLIDGDFRRPVQHQHFDCQKKPGLSDILVERLPFEDVIQKHTSSGVEVLTCGTDVPNPSELLGSEAFSTLLEQLKNVYERIIVDSPPVLPVTDGTVLAAACDASVVVMHSDKTRRQALRQTRMSLESVNASILGLVVNQVSRQKSSSGYYYGNYGYSYGYGNRRETGDGSAAISNGGMEKPAIVEVSSVLAKPKDSHVRPIIEEQHRHHVS